MLINQIRQLLILRIIHQPPQRLTNVLRSSRSKQASPTASKKSVKCRFDCFINPARNSVTLALTASVSFAVSVVIGHTRNSHDGRINEKTPQPRISCYFVTYRFNRQRPCLYVSVARVTTVSTKACWRQSYETPSITNPLHSTNQFFSTFLH
jgi:hypothetical protein